MTEMALKPSIQWLTLTDVVQVHVHEAIRQQPRVVQVQEVGEVGEPGLIFILLQVLLCLRKLENT